MSKWTHSICSTCWSSRWSGRVPVTIKEEFRSEEKCCFCGILHKSGIYVRHNPNDLPCMGRHEGGW